MHVTQQSACHIPPVPSVIPNLIGNPLTIEEIPAFAGMTTIVSIQRYHPYFQMSTDPNLMIINCVSEYFKLSALLKLFLKY